MIISLCNLYQLSLDELDSDYLEFENKDNYLLEIAGYFKLNKEHRSIIENNISFLSKLENEVEK